MSQRLNCAPTRHYAKLAEIAALKEQPGDWVGALRYWEMAENVARLPENRLWAGSRARYYGREAGQGLGYAGRSVSSPDLKSLKNAQKTVKYHSEERWHRVTASPRYGVDCGTT